jgi:hypothetical protein
MSHVQADFGEDGLSGEDSDAGDLIQPRHRLGERGDLLIDTSLNSNLALRSKETSQRLRCLAGDVWFEVAGAHANCDAPREFGGQSRSSAACPPSMGS